MCQAKPPSRWIEVDRDENLAILGEEDVILELWL